MKRKLTKIENILEKTEKRDLMTGCTAFEALFAQRWALCLDNRQAYLEAGGEFDEDPKILSRKASDVKNKKHVLLAIDRFLKEASKTAKVEKNVVLTELMRLAFSDPRSFLNDDGSVKNISELTVAEAAAIKSITVVEIFEGQGAERQFVGYQKKIQFNDKLRALELLCKNLGILNEVGDSISLNQIQINLQVEQVKKLGLDKMKKIDKLING